MRTTLQPVPPDDGTILPEFYFCRSHKSDREWIYIRMRAIPKDKQQSVANEYVRIYQIGDRQARNSANRYLLGIANEYKSLRSKREI